MSTDGNKPMKIKRWRTAHKAEGWFYVDMAKVTVVVQDDVSKRIFMAEIPMRSILARKDTKP